MSVRSPLMVCFLLLPAVLLAVLTAQAADTRDYILVDDVDEWYVDWFCGNPAVRDFLQGPKLEGAAAGGVVFDSRGNAYVACGTFIQIVTSGGNTVTLDDNGNTLEIKGTGQISIEASQDLEVKSQGNMNLEASGNMTIKGAIIQLNP